MPASSLSPTIIRRLDSAARAASGALLRAEPFRSGQEQPLQPRDALTEGMDFRAEVGNVVPERLMCLHQQNRGADNKANYRKELNREKRDDVEGFHNAPIMHERPGLQATSA